MCIQTEKWFRKFQTGSWLKVTLAPMLGLYQIYQTTITLIQVHSFCFLTINKRFDTTEFQFLLQGLNAFGFGSKLIKTVKCFMEAQTNTNTSRRFSINRGVRQGCLISPFQFLIVVELLSISLVKNPRFCGITLFNKEITISQLADGTTLFLKDKNQINDVIKLVKNVNL